jgi:hypothetical protein
VRGADAPVRMLDLARWRAFERANPQVFASMYQFVVQKR